MRGHGVHRSLPAALTWASIQQHGRPQRLDARSHERWRVYFITGAEQLFEDERAWAMVERLADALLAEPTGVVHGPKLEAVLADLNQA